jgi:hypothetical protein
MATMSSKQRPWRTLRCVVEVKVPPSNRSDEKDLIYHVEQQLLNGMFLPRAMHDDKYYARPKVKRFRPVFVAEQRTLAGMTPKASPSAFEQLVIRALYAVIAFTMPRTRSGRESTRMIREDIVTFLGADRDPK